MRAISVLCSLVLLAACTSPDPAGSQMPSADIIGPVTFHCDDGSTIEATFDNAPTPATARLVRGGQQEVLPQAVSASGARYLGDDVEFWNKGRDATVNWQGTSLRCSTSG